MNRFLPILWLGVMVLTACTPVDINAPLPAFDTGVDPEAWASIPAGEFFFGQHNAVETTPAFEIMVTDVTTAQYASYLDDALADGSVRVSADGAQIVGFYPGDPFYAVKHEEPIVAGDWMLVPLQDPAQRLRFDGARFFVQAGYEGHLLRPCRLRRPPDDDGHVVRRLGLLPVPRLAVAHRSGVGEGRPRRGLPAFPVG